MMKNTMTNTATDSHNPLDSFFDNVQTSDSNISSAEASPVTVEVDTELLDDEVEALTIHLADDLPANNLSQPKKSAKTATFESEVDATDVNEFEILGLAPVLLKSIAATGYTTPTPIQAQAIPAAINGRDLLLSAQTGSGKTAAFVLPILQNLSQAPRDAKRGRQPKAVKALILTPTRELAHQVGDSIRKYGSAMKDLFSVPLVGGAAYSGQIRALKKGVQIIVATPGRLLDHINAGRVDLSELEILVLDEADRMLDMGFADDIDRILNATPTNRQTIMSSATWDGPVGKIAESFTDNPERISIKVETAHIDEKVYFCDNFDHKNRLLESLICDQERGQAIIFTATKRSSEELAERLQGWGHKACYLHGDLPQSKRNRIVLDLRAGKYDIVVATDVAARGLDLPNISHVFNYDLPRQVEDYVHRIGRSGRAGRTGIAINLCSRDDRRQFSNISRYLKRDIQESTVEGLEPRFVEKFDSRGRDGNSRGRGRSQGGFGRSGGNSRERGDSRGRSEGFKKPFASRDNAGSSDNRRSNDGSRPFTREGDNGGRRGFDRAAKSSDRTSFQRGENRDSRERNDSRERSNFQEHSHNRERYNSNDRFENREGRDARPARNDWAKKDSRPDFNKPRSPRVSEEVFGERRRSNNTHSGYGNNERTSYADKAKRPQFNSDNRRARGSDSQDGYGAPKRARRDGDFSAKSQEKNHSREGFQRRNSSGKPI